MPYQTLQDPVDFDAEQDAIDQVQFTRNNRLFTVGLIAAAFAAVAAAVLLALV